MVTFTDNKTGGFTPFPSKDTYDLVVGSGAMGLYLQAKLGNILGKPADEILLGTPLLIRAPYANSEGVIEAMTQEKGFVKGLRIDQQKAQVIGGKTYVTFQVQWGTGMGKTGGAYAGALMLANTQFNAGNLREALERSAKSQSYWRIDP